MTISVLTSNHIIDGRGTEPFAGYIVVEDSTIKEVGESSSICKSANRTLDCTNFSLLPGLIDSHVHVGAVHESLGDQHKLYQSSYMSFLVSRRLATMLNCGFTTVRDAGGADVGFKQSIEDGLIVGPRLIQCGHPITQTGGHGDLRQRAETAPWAITDYGMLAQVVDGVDECRRAVREELRRGADAIKVFASGGAISASDSIDSTQYSLGELRAMVEECSDQNTYVFAHALSNRAIERCIDAGVRSIEHGNFLDLDTARKMAAAGTFLVPTFAIYRWLYEHRNEGTLTPKMREKVEAAVGTCQEALRNACAAGVKIASGSDMLSDGLSQMGMEIAFQAEVQGAQAAIESATSVNAELLGLEGTVGTLEPGKEADVIAVAGNPLHDPSILGREADVRLVVKSGEVYKDTRDR